jgi:hypothetical protein
VDDARFPELRDTRLMPVELVEHWHAWCDECDWREDDYPDYVPADQALDDHIKEKH